MNELYQKLRNKGQLIRGDVRPGEDYRYTWMGHNGKMQSVDRYYPMRLWRRTFKHAKSDEVVKNKWMINVHHFMLWVMAHGYVPEEDIIVWIGQWYNTGLSYNSIIVLRRGAERRRVIGSRTRGQYYETFYRNIFFNDYKNKGERPLFVTRVVDEKGKVHRKYSYNQFKLAKIWNRDRINQLQQIFRERKLIKPDFNNITDPEYRAQAEELHDNDPFFIHRDTVNPQYHTLRVMNTEEVQTQIEYASESRESLNEKIQRHLGLQIKQLAQQAVDLQF